MRPALTAAEEAALFDPSEQRERWRLEDRGFDHRKLTGIRLNHAIWTAVDIVNCELETWNVADSQFVQVEFRESLVRSSTFERVVFSECVFFQADFDSASLRGCAFINCRFVACRFDAGEFRANRWENARLVGSTFEHARVDDWSLVNGELASLTLNESNRWGTFVPGDARQCVV
jgi:uncharacterized protein YjbI with pentapeptide repeats